MDAFRTKMKEAGLSEAAIAAFEHNYEQLCAGVTGMMPDAEIDPVQELPKLVELRGTSGGDSAALLKKTAVLKLNGGLGTSMGLEKAKSLLEVKEGKTFLDIIAEQIKFTRKTFDSNVRFVLMNSFSTSADSLGHLAKAHGDLISESDVELLQNKSPKVDKATKGPVEWKANPGLEWCPPGHGDIYPSLLGSGMLDRLMEQGIEYVFVSNSDNLGATLDLDLLKWFASTGNSFAMEVCERTAADKKGGHLARRKADGKLILRESAMCPKEDEAKFQDVGLHRFFNTNNLWLNLPKFKAAIEKNGGKLPLPLITNSKTVDPRDKKSTPVFQLETAMGSAIECFEDAGAVVVPRERFAPVKTCNDLFALRSDAYKLSEDCRVVLAAEAAPFVKLDDEFYKLVDQMEAHCEPYFKPPSLFNCTKLTVSGDIKFSAGVVIKGEVAFKNTSGAQQVVKAGTYENTEVVLGDAVAV